MPDARSSEAPTLGRVMSMTLSDQLVFEAEELGVDISKAAEAGIAQALRKRKEEDWLAENRAALDSWNAYVEKNGLPLERFRLF